MTWNTAGKPPGGTTQSRFSSGVHTSVRDTLAPPTCDPWQAGNPERVRERDKERERARARARFTRKYRPTIWEKRPTVWEKRPTICITGSCLFLEDPAQVSSSSQYRGVRVGGGGGYLLFLSSWDRVRSRPGHMTAANWLRNSDPQPRRPGLGFRFSKVSLNPQPKP